MMKWLLILVLACSRCRYIDAQADYLGCASPWTEHDGKCYKFELLEKTMNLAKEDCANDGASLVSVNNFMEHEYVIRKLTEVDMKGQEWFTSGMRDTVNVNTFTWQGDGKFVKGGEFWFPKASMDIKEGTRIVYYTEDGAEWGWKWRPNDDTARPYICEISKEDSYKIVDEDRGFGYGLEQNDPAAAERGPSFILQPRDVIYDGTGADKFTSIECEASGNPVSTYQWYITKGSRREAVDPLTDDRMTIINGKLLINKPDQTIDNGDYQCVAMNKFGAILSRSVQLSFGYLLDFPKSDRDPIEVNAYDGTGIECNPPQHGYGSILFSWYKDNIPNFVRPELKPYLFISGNGKLYFSSVTEEDEGLYFCMVTPPGHYASRAEGKISMPIQLNVGQSIGNEQEPKLASGFPRVFPSSPKRGNTVRIECFAYASPPQLTYSWERVNGIMPKQARKEDEGRVLVIPNVQLVQRGEYRCRVKRLNGQSADGVVQLPVESPPFFTIPLKNEHVDLGATLTWRCISDGIPTPTYQWYRDASLLDIEKMPKEDRDRFTINTNVLTISDVAEEDAGMYQCMAENTHGSQYSSAQLRVVSMAPSFSKSPLEPLQYATLNQNMTIFCNPEAAPHPLIIWRKDGQEMDPSWDMQGADHVIQLPNGNLHIKRVRDSDAGNYTCIATNNLGEAQSSTRLSILASTTLTQMPQDNTVEVNRTAFFRCEASFSPVFDVTYDWYHNHRKLDFIRIYSDGSSKVWIEKEPFFERGTGINKGSLYIRDTQFYHAGDYTCVAKTSGEEIIHTVSLQVIGPPSEPAGIYGDSPTNQSIVLHWSESNPNGRAITSFIIEAFNMREGYWKRIKSNIRGDDLKKRSTVIGNLVPWTQYKFRVRAENVLGESDPSDESPKYKTLPDKPGMSPTNVGGGGGKVGVLTISWDPIPTEKRFGEGLGYVVKWKKDDMEEEQYDMCRVIDDALDPKDENCLLHATYNPVKSHFVVTLGAESCYFNTRTGKEECRDNYYSKFRVKVLAFNQMGQGPSSPEVVIRSAEGLPTAVPTNIRAVYFNSTSLLVEWDPVEDTIEAINGLLKGYRINYWQEEGEDETMAIFRPIPGQTDHGLIVGLYPGTYYVVTVQVYNEAGVGPKSQEFNQETLRSAPKEAPQEVKVYPIDYNSIEVQWRGVSTEIGEEPLEGYMIRYWRQGENMVVGEEYDAYKRTYADIDGLSEGIVYNLRVFGYSRGGEGLKSSPTVQFILGPNCHVIEDQPDKDYVYKCTGCQLAVNSLTLLSTVLLVLYTHLYRSL